MSLHSLYPTVVANVAEFLSLADVARLSSATKQMYQYVAKNEAVRRRSACADHFQIWCALSIKYLGVDATLHKEKRATIGLAENDLSWSSFFRVSWLSQVFTWGSGGGRMGHESSLRVEHPKACKGLAQQAITFVGKTAEVGSIAISLGGSRVYLWGRHALSQTPIMLEASAISDVPGDTFLEGSCGHDSGYIIVMRSGKVYINDSRNMWGDDRKLKFFDLTEAIVSGLLDPKEKPVQVCPLF